ncbi:MAG: GAF domain-containing protein [Anaerolineales bacterium]|nr:GAF domain-containing protein [Anaerolineales bacterium]
MHFDPDLLFVILLGVIGIVYLVLIVQALRHRSGQEDAAYWMVLYAIFALILVVLEALWRAGRLALDGEAFWRVQIYGILALALTMALVNRAYLRLRGGAVWLGLGVFFFATAALVSSRLFPLPEILWTNGRSQFPSDRLGVAILLLGWIIFFATTLQITRLAYRRTRQPLHRNRISYWLPIVVLLFVNDALILNFRNAWGSALRLIAVWLMIYILTRHRLSDVRQIFRQGFTYVAGIGLVGGAYVGGYYLLRLLPGFLPGVDPFLLGLLVTGSMVGVAAPFYGLLRGVIYRLLPVESYNPSQTLRDYSIMISNILDVERLATVAVGLIIEAVDIRRGFLFLVDRETGPDGQLVYRLRAVRGAGERPLRIGTLSGSGPIAGYFIEGHRPLLQYDVDMLPEFQRAAAAERDWLASLDTEVSVPIFSKGEWIGMLALGAKSSGNRYTDDDLNVLTTLANQTAVALENARLVENLMRLNREIRQAYQALDQANRNLERLDRTKSDFISIASHELRTPLTVLRGYTEMLLDDPIIRANQYHYKTIEGIHKGTLRLHEIMDSMFDIAAIDTRSLDLSLQMVDVPELIRGVCSGLAGSARERAQSLNLNLPALPAIKADPKTLQKVFHHLVTNAIKFTPNGGRIMVAGRALAGNQRDLPEGGIEIVVVDTGVGVDPNYRELIFSKFYQSEDNLGRHSTGKTKFKGSGAGLGLALARGIVEAHGGRIWVESPGYDEVNFPGSQFHVVLPLSHQSDSATIRIGSEVKMKL